MNDADTAVIEFNAANRINLASSETGVRRTLSDVPRRLWVGIIVLFVPNQPVGFHVVRGKDTKIDVQLGTRGVRDGVITAIQRDELN